MTADPMMARLSGVPTADQWPSRGGPQLIAERGVFTVLSHAPEQVQFEFDLLRVDRRTGTMTAEVTVCPGLTAVAPQPARVRLPPCATPYG